MRPGLLFSSKYAVPAFLYAVLIIYASTMVGPNGVHFVPIDPRLAMSRLFEITYVQPSANHHSNWVGNIALMVPMGFLLAGWCCFARRMTVVGGLGAILIGFELIVAIKFAQLYFLPRTVSLNYIVAQSIGLLGGSIAYGGLYQVPAKFRVKVEGIQSLRFLLATYTLLASVFLLIPFDFARTTNDLASILLKLSSSMTLIDGAGRPPAIMAAFILGSIVSMVPVGAFLTFVGGSRLHIGRSTGAATLAGFCGSFAIYLLTAIMVSGKPSLPAVLFRTIGIGAGAYLMHRLVRLDPARVKPWLPRMVLTAIPIYLMGLAALNGLISTYWAMPDLALRGHSWLPLYNYYMAPRAEAAKSIVLHIAMYAPIGALVAIHVRRVQAPLLAGVIATLLSALMEGGRFLRPGLTTDVNNIPLAAVAAWAAAIATPVLWRMMASVYIGWAAPRPAEDMAVKGWRERAADRKTRRRGRGAVIGEIEHY